MGSYDVLDVAPIYLVDFGHEFDLHTDPLGDLDRPIDALFRRDTPQKCRILVRRFTEPVLVIWQPMIDIPLPVKPRQWLPLGIGDRDAHAGW
jgi:hypothetical protein